MNAQSINAQKGNRPEDAQDTDLVDAMVEIRHHKMTITTLRDELESMSFQKDDAVQEAVSVSNDELVQLRNTVSALREELENMRFQSDEDVQNAVANANDEIIQLRNTANALRERHCQVNLA